MIINHIKDKPLKQTPVDVMIKLHEYNKNLELFYNEDENRYEFYLRQGDNLTWQISAPSYGEVTPGVVDWLKKYDSSKGGKLDTDDRKKRWQELCKIALQRNELIKQKGIDEAMYEVRHRCHWLDRYRQNQRQVVVPTMVVGIVNGKKVRAYRKKETIIGA